MLRKTWLSCGFGVWLGAFLTLATSTTASPPCADLSPVRDDRDQLGYRLRGDRCEGLYRRDTSGPRAELRLVSLTLGRIKFPFAEDTVLEVRRDPGLTEPVQVRSQPLPGDVPYQMDAVLASGTRLRWPVREVLHPADLDASRLGVLGSFPGRNPPVYVPLWVGEAHLPATTGAPFAIVRTSGPIDYLRWRTLRFEPATGRCLEPAEWTTPQDRSRDAGETIEINSLAAAPRSFCLEVHSRDKGAEGQPVTLEVRVTR